MSRRCCDPVDNLCLKIIDLQRSVRLRRWDDVDFSTNDDHGDFFVDHALGILFVQCVVRRDTSDSSDLALDAILLLDLQSVFNW